MNILPQAKLENIVVNTLKDEVLVYDLSTNLAVCLNSTSANVFNACDGVTTFDELKGKYSYTDDLIYLALDELRANDLLDESSGYISPFANLSRREAIKKVGLASMVALPMISAIVAPASANAASRGTQANNTTCTTQTIGDSTECASGNCVTAYPSRTLTCCASLIAAAFPLEKGQAIAPTNDQTFCDQSAPGLCCSGTGIVMNGQCFCN